MGELLLLNFQPIQIQMLQGFVFHLVRTAGEREVGSWREFSDETSWRKKKYSSGWQKASRKKKLMKNSNMCMYYI